MSIWTHVSGCIRIDGLEFLDDNIKSSIKSAFGKTCQWEDPKNVWDECTVPCGSEGSIQYSVVKTGSENSLAWGLVYLWGDLRDYESPDEIFKWLQVACNDFWIRNCAVEIEVEGKSRHVVFLENGMKLKMIDVKGDYR